MSREIRVRIRPDGNASNDAGAYGRATYHGKSRDGEDVYAVYVASTVLGFERRVYVRARDLEFVGGAA